MRRPWPTPSQLDPWRSNAACLRWGRVMSKPKPMTAEDLDDLRREVECGNLGEAIGELLAAHDYWRNIAERHGPDVRDVESHAVTAGKRDAWLRKQAHVTEHFDDRRQTTEWRCRGLHLCQIEAEHPWPESQTVGLLRSAARGFGRSAWDILAEMAAMEVSDGE